LPQGFEPGKGYRRDQEYDDHAPDLIARLFKIRKAPERSGAFSFSAVQRRVGADQPWLLQSH